VLNKARLRERGKGRGTEEDKVGFDKNQFSFRFFVLLMPGNLETTVR
jgi:hypothetical protein